MTLHRLFAVALVLAAVAHVAQTAYSAPDMAVLFVTAAASGGTSITRNAQHDVRGIGSSVSTDCASMNRVGCTVRQRGIRCRLLPP
jgi:hypothetical protein